MPDDLPELEDTTGLDDLDITELLDGADEWTVTLASGGVIAVPKDPGNTHHQSVLRWIAAGGLVEVGEVGARRRLRKRLQNDPFERAVVLELAAMSGRTPKQVIRALVEHLT